MLMNRSSLKKRIYHKDFDEVERQNNYPVKGDSNITITNGALPFGESYFTWREMKQIAQAPYDSRELWYYDDTHVLSGSAGYAIFIIYNNGTDKEKVIMTGWNIVLARS